MCIKLCCLALLSFADIGADICCCMVGAAVCGLQCCSRVWLPWQKSFTMCQLDVTVLCLLQYCAAADVAAAAVCRLQCSL
jgi:hypothetical protein